MVYLDKIGLAGRGFARAFPFIVPFNMNYFEKIVNYFCFLAYGLDLLNHTTKSIMRKIYVTMNSFPIIGEEKDLKVQDIVVFL